MADETDDPFAQRLSKASALFGETNYEDAANMTQLALEELKREPRLPQ
jgi:hypothetical protein